MRISHALYEVHAIDALAQRDLWMNRIHPLPKLLLTIAYIAVSVSFQKYDIFGLSGMAVYLIAGFILGELSFRECIWRLRVVLPIVCLAGIANPFFDRATVAFGPISMRAGFLSMATLMLKGAFAVFASYLLIATTSIEKICGALRMLHVPKVLVTQILLSYRYITVLLGEAGRVTQAYELRAPRQRGVHFKVWGSLAGQMLMRSVDRANNVYESMLLRGYDGEFRAPCHRQRMRPSDAFYFLSGLPLFSFFEKYR